MGGSVVSTAVVLARVTTSACAASLIRQQTFSAQVAANGNIEISGDLVDSLTEQTSTLVRNMAVDTKGNIEIGTGGNVKVVALNESVEIAAEENISEKGGQFVQLAVCYKALENVASDGGSDLKSIAYTHLNDCERNCTDQDECHSFVACPKAYGLCFLKDGKLDSNVAQKVVGDCKSYYKASCTSTAQSWTTVGGGRGPEVQPIGTESALQADATTQHTLVVVRKTEVKDATQVTELTEVSERDAVWTNLVKRSFGYLRIFVGSKNIALICFCSTVVGCLAAAVIGRGGDLRDRVARAINQTNRTNCSLARIDSDGDLGSSDERDSSRLSSPSSYVITTGLLWKLERRFIHELMSHEGSSFEAADRFAYLDHWDLRFFSLDVDDGAVLLSYVSELNKYTSAIFEIKSIESKTVTIPDLQIRSKVSSKKSPDSNNSAMIENFSGYLERLRQIGYEPPKSDTHDPECLFIFIVSGVRQGEIGSSRPVGRLNFKTTDDATDHMCLGSSRESDCQRWHCEISDLLKQQSIEKGVRHGRRRPTSELHERVTEQALAEALAKKTREFGSAFSARSSFAPSSVRSSFALDAEYLHGGFSLIDEQR